MTMNDTTIPETKPDIVHPTRRGRMLSAALVVLTIALLLPFMFFVLPFLNTGFNPLPLPNQIMLIKAILVSVAALGVASGVTLIQSGRKILRTNQCPPPDAWVWRDTKVVRGSRAILLGRIYIVSAALCCVLCVGLTGYVLVVLDQIKPGFNLPAGAKLIEYQTYTNKK
jgi:hypothetical protein